MGVKKCCSSYSHHHHSHHHHASAEEEKLDEGDEAFENDGDAEADEETIDKWQKMFDLSHFSGLTESKLRQMLRVGKLKTFKQGEQLFKAQTETTQMHILYDGVVHLLPPGAKEADNPKIVSVVKPEKDRSRPDDKEKPKPPVEVVEVDAHLEGLGSHHLNCTVFSATAKIFVFQKETLCDSCSVDSFTDIVRLAYASRIMNEIPLFSFAFTHDEQDKLAKQAEYHQWLALSSRKKTGADQTTKRSPNRLLR
jgi:hypothetical protein